MIEIAVCTIRIPKQSLRAAFVLDKYSQLVDVFNDPLSNTYDLSLVLLLQHRIQIAETQRSRAHIAGFSANEQTAVQVPRAHGPPTWRLSSMRTPSLRFLWGCVILGQLVAAQREKKPSAKLFLVRSSAQSVIFTAVFVSMMV